MKKRLVIIALLLIMSIAAAAQSFGFLRTSNSFGDYWIYVTDGTTLVMIYDVNAQTFQMTDRRASLSDFDFSNVKIVRGQAANLASFHLPCKQAGCVSSDFTSGTFNSIDVFCNQEQDCQAFLNQLQ